MYGSSLHWGPGWTDNGFLNTHQTYKPGLDLSADFHTYRLIWSETYIGTYIDGESKKMLDHLIKKSFWQLGGGSYNSHWTNPWKYGSTNAPFDQEFYLIINLACVGLNGFFLMVSESHGTTLEFIQFTIDSVKVWAQGADREYTRK